MADYCCLCLSGERRRAAVSARHLQHTLLIYLDLKVVTWVCWECEARLLRLSAFRLQVEEAQKVLQKLPKGPLLQPLRTLSTLAYHHKNTFDECLVQADKDFKEEFISSELKIYDTKIKQENDSNEFQYEINNQHHETASDNETKTNALKSADNKDYSGYGHDDGDGNGDDIVLEAKGSGHVDINDSYRTIKLSETELSELRERVKAGAKYTAAEHKCESCIMILFSREKLEYHIDNFHSLDNRYECSVCKQRLETKKLRSSHHKAHYYTYECNLCQYKNWKLDRIRWHYVKKHKKSSVKCKICKMEFESYKLRVEHQRQYHLVRKECPVCRRMVPSARFREHVTRHSKRKPKSERKPMDFKQCPTCKKYFQNLHQHMKAHLPKKKKENAEGVKGITKEKPSENRYCVECDRRFPTVGRYQAHLASAAPHAERKYECAHCGAKYLRKDTLEGHITAVHVKGNRHACRFPDCKQVFLQRKQLLAHLSARHAHAPPPKDKFCPHCNKGFATKRTLDNHIVTHTGERPHRCPQCDKGFTQKQCVTAHLLKAHGILSKVEGTTPAVPDATKRFICHDCGKGYSKPQTLRAHRWRLHGQPLYEYPNK